MKRRAIIYQQWGSQSWRHRKKANIGIMQNEAKMIKWVNERTSFYTPFLNLFHRVFLKNPRAFINSTQTERAKVGEERGGHIRRFSHEQPVTVIPVATLCGNVFYYTALQLSHLLAFILPNFDFPCLKEAKNHTFDSWEHEHRSVKFQFIYI